jgi:glycosyltransferase involved in cell wall biosynthesis
VPTARFANGVSFDMTQITVILCTYNRCQILPMALESIAASELPDSTQWEVLVVDNNSTDQTREVVQDFCRRYPGRFRYLFEPQQGKSYALNAAIRESQSEILAFADDDALVESGWLWDLTSSLYGGDWVGAGGRIVPVWPRSLPAWLATSDPHTMGPFVAFDLGSEAGPLTRPPYGANMAFRREAFEKYGNFRTDLGPRPGSEIRREDIEFAERLLVAGEPLRYQPGAVVHHPVPEGRMKKMFVLRWWFWYGYSEVAESGAPPSEAWLVAGLPLYLLRRCLRWALQWIVSLSAPRRFACLRNAWYLAGSLLAYSRKPWRKRPQVAPVIEIGRGEVERAEVERGLSPADR